MSRRATAFDLYLTEGEIADRLGMSLIQWKATANALEKIGFPRPDPLFDHRRYWPAVKSFLDRRAGVGNDIPSARRGEETWDDNRGRKSRAGA